MRYYPLLNRLLWMATVGGTATLTYAALTWSLAVLTALPAAFASLASYAVAAVLSYFGHRGLTFRSRRSHREAVWPFIGVSLFGYATAFAIPGLFTGAMGARIEISILLTCTAVPALNYVAMSQLVFREPDKAQG